MERSIEPKERLAGEVVLPGDKSISHRAVMAGAIACGKTVIKNLLECDDCNFTIQAFKDMGLRIISGKGGTTITGRGLKGLKKPAQALHLGNSGTSMRLLAGILAGQGFESTLTGDAGLLRRPMRRVVEPLREMGVSIIAEDNEHPPLFIKGGRGPMPITYTMSVASAQVKSAILFAGLYADGLTVVREKVQTRDHTERMLAFFGADIRVKENTVVLRGGRELSARRVTVPGDVSSAAFLIAGATVLPRSKLTVKAVSLNPTRIRFIEVLKRMGAKIRVKKTHDACEPIGDIVVESAKTRGVVVSAKEIPAIVDEIPALAVVAALSQGRTVFKGVGELRVKETDRVASIASNLNAMGGRVRAQGDELIIHGVERLSGGSIKSYDDHRTAMAMTIAALAGRRASRLDDDRCVSKSFPRFFEVLASLAV